MIWFKFYSAWGDGIQELTDEEAGRFIKAVCRYAEDEKIEQLSGVERILFAMVLRQMKQDAEHAEKVSNVRAEARRGKGNQVKQMITNDNNSNQLISNDNNCVIKNKELRIKNSEQRIKNSEEELRDISPKAETKHRRGEYQHVLLTDSEVGKLTQRFPNDWQMRIQALDDYLENNRKKHYDNHYLTICKWASNEKTKPIQIQESWIDVANRLSQEVNA